MQPIKENPHTMQKLTFPLRFTFKLLTPSNDFSVFDADGNEVAYTRQRIFKIKEKIDIFQSARDNTLLYTIQADRIIDFGANYAVRDADGNKLGHIKRNGMKFLWKTSYIINDAAGQLVYGMHEANPWTAVADSLVGEIPVLGLLTGYFLNPSYIISTPDGQEIFCLKKEASLFERKFSLYKTGEADPQQDILALNAAMMLMLLERRDG